MLNVDNVMYGTTPNHIVTPSKSSVLLNMCLLVNHLYLKQQTRTKLCPVDQFVTRSSGFGSLFAKGNLVDVTLTCEGTAIMGN